MLDGVPAQVIVVVPAPDLGTVTAGLGGAAGPGGGAAGPGVGAAGPGCGLGPPGSAPPGGRRQGPVLLGNGHGPAPVSREQARRLACGDAEVRRLVTDADGVITELGRSRRVASRDQRRYLLLRDGGCRFAGCGMPADRCQPHHLLHWADGGGTDVATMACLCTHCHHLVHEGGFALAGDPEAELITLRPDGTEVGRTIPVPVPTQLAV
ncbi:MAG: HNH endonuclease signature motif containing protein [Candidatus Nanopelagicales bacterium]